MRRTVAAVALAAAALTATGCSREAASPGSLSAEDEQQLNDAAAMLDANSVDANAVAENEADPDA